jgi:hypothetical protein|tara:strand:- start:96 stop:251 length:156 start_codon:yes stop_codon:yes gene_type:complete
LTTACCLRASNDKEFFMEFDGLIGDVGFTDTKNLIGLPMYSGWNYAEADNY